LSDHCVVGWLVAITVLGLLDLGADKQSTELLLVSHYVAAQMYQMWKLSQQTNRNFAVLYFRHFAICCILISPVFLEDASS